MITNPNDKQILRDLAKRVAEVAALPIMAERRELWRRHHRLDPVRPMILVFPEGAWREMPVGAMHCQEEKARRYEWELLRRLYTYEHFQDDTVCEAEWKVGKVIRSTGWGLEAQWHHSASATGARTFCPVITHPGDLKKLRYPEISYDEKATKENLAEVQDLFGGILDVKLIGVGHISFHLMSIYTSLRGLEQVMEDMALNPEWLHDAMAFLAEGERRRVQQYVDQNLLSLNNDSTYHSSGGNGYTDELPRPDYDPQRVRPCDMWASAEAQELALVSPAMHNEFSLQYEKKLLAPFGLNGYGCCEDLSRKLDDVLTIPNIRRLSISPFANVDVCAEKLGKKAIFSWKPHPAHLAGEFNHGMVRDYIAHTLDVARGCVLEMILKDTHTCEHHPERFDQWTAIARELVEAG